MLYQRAQYWQKHNNVSDMIQRGLFDAYKGIGIKLDS